MFFRLVSRNPPTTEDFFSNNRKGRPIPPQIDPDLADGISVQVTIAQLRSRSFVEPECRYIAELHIPDDARFRVERTLTFRGHHTLWGNPLQLLSCVVRVHPRDIEQTQ